VLDPGFATSLDGEARAYAEGSTTLLYVFGLALLLIYLVLAAQFESFRDPLTILLTVPLALTGALLSLWYFGQTLNVFSQIGMIMLIGLVTKHGILIVEFANQRKAAGLGVRQAIEEAAAARFRPDPDDRALHDPGHPADRAGAGRGLGEPHADGHRGRRRDGDRHGADAVRGAGGLHLLHRGAPRPDGGAARGAGAQRRRALREPERSLAGIGVERRAEGAV
jgi:hypothetical protein